MHFVANCTSRIQNAENLLFQGSDGFYPGRKKPAVFFHMNGFVISELFKLHFVQQFV